MKITKTATTNLYCPNLFVLDLTLRTRKIKKAGFFAVVEIGCILHLMPAKKGKNEVAIIAVLVCDG